MVTAIVLCVAVPAGMTLVSQAAPSSYSEGGSPQEGAPVAALDVHDDPITVTVSFQQGLDDYEGVSDTFIASTSSDGNFNADTRISLYADGRYKGLIRFDLSSIASQVTILDASLTMEIYYLSGAPTAMTVSAYPISRPWNIDEVTWNRASADTPWAGAGCSDTQFDRSATPAGAVSAKTTGSYQIDVTSAVTHWVANQEENFGLLLVAAGSPAVQSDHASSEYWMASVRPKLTVTYSVTGPLPTFTPTATRTPTPTSTPEPSVLITSTMLAANPPCLAVGPDYDADPGYPDHGSVFAFWQGTPTFARLWLQQANVDGEHSLYVNGNFVGRTMRDSRGSICGAGTGYYYHWDFDPAYLINGYNTISFHPRRGLLGQLGCQWRLHRGGGRPVGARDAGNYLHQLL